MTTAKDPIFKVSSQDWADLAEQLGEETDRGAALVAAAFLDYLLAALIESFLVDDDKSSKALLKGPLAPLSGFSSRIAAAYSLGLISEDERHDLDIIREIRNHFAHGAARSTFSLKTIEQKVRKLRVPRLVPKNIFDAEHLEPRRLFINAAAMLSTFLEMRRAKMSDKRKPAPKFYIEWKERPG